MARRKKSDGPTPVEAITHDSETRANLPTADAHEFVTPEIEASRKVRYPRDPSLDPQLVWRGKDERDSEDLEVDAPPIYIQEKIDPRVLIENLRKTAKEGENEPELILFNDFDGLAGLDSVEFYQHAANWSNRMILGDSLQVMTSLAERESLRGQAQMVYIDPPYGIDFKSNWQLSTRSRSVRDGSLQHITREVEVVRAFRDTWELGIHSYLTYMRERLIVARDLLAEAGSLFIQIGSANAHLVTSLAAEIFGSENHVETIAFRKKTMPLGGRLLEGAYDYLVWFARNKDVVKYRRLYKQKDVEGDSHWNLGVLPDGSARALTAEEISNHALLGEDVDVAQLISLYPVGPFDTGIYPYEFEGKTYEPPPGKSWATPKQGMDRLAAAGRLVPYKNGETLRYLLKLSDYPVTVYNNVWSDTSAATGMRYVVETSPKVVERCILMTTDPGDLVIDPTCGSGTTAYVSEQWGRRWVTVDTARVALALARQRLMGARYASYRLADQEADVGAASRPGDVGRVPGDVRYGFIYETVPHITLKAIANNPKIAAGMSFEEVSAAIREHTEEEPLYDQPVENRRRVRVAGPFTVESLSPHRSAASAEGQLGGDRSSSEEDLAQSILDNLLKAGIQNGRRQERIEFERLEPYAGPLINAVGVSQGTEHAALRVGITIGPQYGTVGPVFIKNAAREAIRVPDIDVLCVLGFAFDPAAIGTLGESVTTADEGFDVAAERKLGNVPVLIVRMNADLVMGEELKKTGAGNLFTVFGEPDIAVRSTRDGELVVQLSGVDVYDPTTGELRSNSTDQVAMWMIDTDYDEESFFVRHCYFTGGFDTYKRLKRSLRADIDEDAWASAYRTESRPFPRSDTGKIAVKVINDYGDEVLKIIEV